MSNNNINTRLPCNYKNKIIKALDSLETLKKIIKLDNRVVNIILEETILVQWIQIKKTNKYINKLLKKVYSCELQHFTSFPFSIF